MQYKRHRLAQVGAHQSISTLNFALIKKSEQTTTTRVRRPGVANKYKQSHVARAHISFTLSSVCVRYLSLFSASSNQKTDVSRAQLQRSCRRHCAILISGSIGLKFVVVTAVALTTLNLLVRLEFCRISIYLSNSLGQKMLLFVFYFENFHLGRADFFFFVA